MEDQPKDRVVLRFYINPDWDARTQSAYVYAPDNWADMTEAEQEQFLAEQAEEWALERVEFGAHVHDPDEEAAGGWESGDPNEIEERFPNRPR